MKYRSFLVLLSLCLLSPLQGYFASVKALGMGGCGVANPQDALAAAYNPAGMVWVGTRADLGAHGRYTGGRVTIEQSDLLDGNGSFLANRGTNFVTPSFGVNWMVCDCIDFSIGAVCYTKQFTKASYAEPLPTFGTSSLSMQFWQGVLSPVCAIRFEQFSLGISVDFISARLKAGGLQYFDNAIFSTNPGSVTNRKESSAGAITYTIGGLYKCTPTLSFAAMWQLQAKGGHFQKYSGLMPQNAQIQLPSRVAGGLYWKLSAHCGVALDVEHIGWNRVDFWHNCFSTSLSDLYANPFGAAAGPGFGWEDETIFHIGTDIQFSPAITFRAGYRYGRSPVKSRETYMNTLTLNIVEQEISVGVTVDLGYSGEISGYYSYGIEKNLQGSSLAEFGGGVYSLSSQRQAAGISYGWGW